MNAPDPEWQMRAVRRWLALAQQAPTKRDGDARVAIAANILAGVVHRNGKVVPLETFKRKEQ